MINENNGEGNGSWLQKKGIFIQLLPNKQKPKEDVSVEQHSVMSEGNLLNSKLFQEVSKLISLYSQSNSTEELTKQEFKLLAVDLYETVDKKRKLTDAELNNLVNLFDSDKNQSVSRQEIMTIVRGNKLTSAHIPKK